jgi:hypothetical protein
MVCPDMGALLSQSSNLEAFFRKYSKVLTLFEAVAETEDFLNQAVFEVDCLSNLTY